MDSLIITIVGYAASICMVLGYMPQAIATIRTRDTEGIAMSTFCMMGLGSIFFVIQGIMLNNIPLVITNVITTISSAIIFTIKIQNDLKSRKKK
jgi:MtN3 and saliva related transmembrane protein